MRKGYQLRWYCISEDDYLGKEFFDVIKKTAKEHIEVMHIGVTSHFIINLFSLLENIDAIKLELSDITDEIINERGESISDEELDKETFKRYQKLYKPFYFYLFDTDRLHGNFFSPEGRVEASSLKKSYWSKISI